jgi:predicted ATPase
MISRLRVQGFKRFNDHTFSLAPLTVLAGLNGAGKTSVVQSFLIMRQGCTGPIVQLNGPFGLELGTADDVSNWAGRDEICFAIDEADEHYEWKLTWPAEDSMYLDAEAPRHCTPACLSHLPRSFTYLSPERMGPRRSHPGAGVPPEELEVGFRGEHCAQLLSERGNKPIEDANRRHPKSEGASFLKYEVERWLSDIARPIEIDAVRLPGSTVYSLSFRDFDGTFVKATNMGFGVTFALPVVLAGLVARPGGLLIVENPEAHLHPAGQSQIGLFLAWLSGKGVQVILETHSDHVLNGIRRAIGEHKYIAATDAVVHFFAAGKEAVVEELSFTKIGGISHWPRGFFDQFVIDTSALGRVRREDHTDGVRG